MSQENVEIVRRAYAAWEPAWVKRFLGCARHLFASQFATGTPSLFVVALALRGQVGKRLGV
jgi:hypothetical protein